MKVMFDQCISIFVWVQTFAGKAAVVKITVLNEDDLLLPAKVFQLVVHVFYLGLQVLAIFAVAYGGNPEFDVRIDATRFGDDALQLIFFSHHGQSRLFRCGQSACQAGGEEPFLPCQLRQAMLHRQTN